MHRLPVVLTLIATSLLAVPFAYAQDELLRPTPRDYFSRTPPRLKIGGGLVGSSFGERSAVGPFVQIAYRPLNRLTYGLALEATFQRAAAGFTPFGQCERIQSRCVGHSDRSAQVSLGASPLFEIAFNSRGRIIAIPLGIDFVYRRVLSEEYSRVFAVDREEISGVGVGLHAATGLTWWFGAVRFGFEVRIATVFDSAGTATHVPLLLVVEF